MGALFSSTNLHESRRPLGEEKIVTGSVTHFEIYAEEPPKLAEFYQRLLGWRIEQAPGIDYWRIQSSANSANGLNGGLTYRPFPGPRSWFTEGFSTPDLKSAREQLERLK
jgi:predicted enzyme related to lactoylglutathione lyase